MLRIMVFSLILIAVPGLADEYPKLAPTIEKLHDRTLIRVAPRYEVIKVKPAELGKPIDRSRMSPLLDISPKKPD